MEFHQPARFPRGFRCASRNVGIKAEGNDLSLFVSDAPATAAAVFTRNHIVGAPVVVGRELIRAGRLRAVVVNSKVSNVGMGELGIRNARRMGEAAGHELEVPAAEVLMSSTGVIGVPLPIERIEQGIIGMGGALQDDPLVGALGIMTTDTHPKTISCSAGDSTITWVAKGAGMIDANMATMLVYIFTDARFEAVTLDRMLRDAVADSFNMLSVDTDTSTSDTCVLMANGLAGEVGEPEFSAALRSGCIRMTEILARDGEGATKLLRARVTGAKQAAEARIIAKSLINSPLIKTMAFGADPNVGRVLMAVGKCFECSVDAARMGVRINEVDVFSRGERLDFDEVRLRELLAGDPVEISVDLGLGDGSAIAYGCDLTHGYIEENAAYYSS
jgi:glutamate N-acetyltransferase / amino-acid N-acetyltransferase